MFLSSVGTQKREKRNRIFNIFRVDGEDKILFFSDIFEKENEI